MPAQFRGPSGLNPRYRAGIEPVGFDHLRGDDPGRRPRFAAFSVSAFLPGPFVPLSIPVVLAGFFGGPPLKEAGSGEDHGGSVSGPGIEIAFPVFRDVAQQAAQDRPVDRVVVGAVRTLRSGRAVRPA